MQKRSTLLGVLAAAALLAAPPVAQARVAVGIGIGFPIFPGPFCGPYCGPYFYRPYPVYVAPPPVYVQPAPVYVQPAQPVYQAAPAPASAYPPAPVTAYSPGSTREGDIQRYTQGLQHTDPRERAEAAVQLGRLRAASAVPSLSALLTNDRSPAVRDAAARALGLVGSADALSALQRAAQADDDRDVRRDASYAAEVIRTSLQK
jgi:hypothetical protein